MSHEAVERAAAEIRRQNEERERMGTQIITRSDEAPEFPVDSPQPETAVTLFGSSDPGAVLERATAVSTALMRVVRDQKLAVNIGGRDHLRVEAWTLMGSMVGVFPVVEWTRPVMAEGKQIGWEARVECHTRDGSIVGAAESMCLRSENTWKGRDDFALRSMAQTRATSKALATALRFIAVLAGYAGTPAEEMPRGDAGRPQETRHAPQRTSRPERAVGDWQGVRCPRCAEHGFRTTPGGTPAFWLKDKGPNAGQFTCNGRTDEIGVNGERGWANHKPDVTPDEIAAVDQSDQFDYEAS